MAAKKKTAGNKKTPQKKSASKSADASRIRKAVKIISVKSSRKVAPKKARVKIQQKNKKLAATVPDRAVSAAKPSNDVLPAPHIAVVLQDNADKFTLLDNVLQQSGFWFALQEKLYRTGLDKDSFKILIKPDFNACELLGSTATDPELVEYLIDLLHDRGFSQVLVGESRNSYDMWLENRDVQILADVLGYQYVTPSGRSYDVIDLSEDTVQGPFAEGSILYNSHLSSVWLTTDFHILFSKNKTDDEAAYYLGLNNLISLLPLRDKDYHYKHRLNQADVLIELLHHIEIDFCIIDAYVSNHGNAGTRVARPLNTNTLIAGQNLLLTDYAAVLKMGTDLQSSPLHSLAQQAFGLPAPYRIDGDTTPYPDWIGVNPLMLYSTRSRTQWVELDQILQPWLQTVDQESFSFKDPLNANINKWVSVYLQGIDDNPNVFWSIISINYVLAYIHTSFESLNVMYRKDRLRHQEVPLNVTIDAYPLEAYKAIVNYLEPLEATTQRLQADSNGLRWKFHEDGSVLFEFSRAIPVEYEDFVEHVDITKSIQYMNDYIGGLIVPVKKDAQGQVTHQVERNIYLPQPNYLVIYQGMDIDVSKLEYIHYGENEQKMLWQTIKSENGSATYDDGIVRFTKTENGETLVSIFGRQEFTLPLFWQLVDLDNFPALKERLFNHAYTTFFTNTMANFEAVYEGRDVRIGKLWNQHFGEPEEAHLQSPSEKMASVLTLAQEYIQDNMPNKEGLLASLFTAYKPQPEYVDEAGFAHFKHDSQSQTRQGIAGQNETEGLQAILLTSKETALGFWKELYEAILKDSGIKYG